MEKKQKGRLKNISAISLPVQIVLDKLKKGEPLTEVENELLLTPVEVATILSWKKGSEVSPRYLPQMIRDGRLEPDSLAGGHSYRYKLSNVLQIQFRPPGRPATSSPEA